MASKTPAMVRQTMEPLPEHVIEAITVEQPAIDLAELTGRTVEEVKNDGVHTTLVALPLFGGVPESRADLPRLAEGESFVRPATETADPPTGGNEAPTGPAEIDAAALSMTASNGTGNSMPNEPTSSTDAPNAARSTISAGMGL